LEGSDTEGIKSLGLWKRVEVLGDVGIISLPFQYDEKKARELAQRLMKQMRLRSIWGRLRGTEGEHRLGNYVHLAGEKRSEVIYKENGCTFFLDFRKVFFSQTLSFEHLRVAREVRRGEIIVNMFSGYGPFSILAAKLGDASVVYSFDINPYGYYYMHINRWINRTPQVIPILRDSLGRVREIREADRIIAPLPERWRNAWEVIVKNARKGVMVNLYVEVQVEREEDPLQKASLMIPGGKYRVVRSLKPSLYHVAVDIQL
jgi:tRNA (guanine37-N1)-methyltransferase